MVDIVRGFDYYKSMDYLIAREKIKHVSHRHHGIMLWMLVNPHKPLKECAKELGYSQPWLSCVIHSDAFQAQFDELKIQSRDDVCMGLKDKMTGLAHQAVDKLSDQIALSEDPSFILSAADKMLSKLGYAPQTANVNINTGGGAIAVTQVSRETVENAQALRLKAIEAKNAEKLIEGEVIDEENQGS